MNKDIIISFYEDSAGKSFKSEKHYQWFLANKDSREFKDKRRIENKSYYQRKGERLRANQVSKYHKSNPDARHNNPSGTRIRQAMSIFS